MEVSRLRKIGFSDSEARVYVTLLELGISGAGEISKKSNLNRTTTYDALKRLLEKGLISYSVHANRKIFKASPPKKILFFLKEQEKEAKEITSNLNEIYKKSKNEESFNIYEGKKGIRAILQDILKYREYVVFGSKGRFLEIMKHDFVAFQNRKKDLKIKARIIINESAKKEETVRVTYAKFKFVPDQFSGPSTTFVYGNNIVIIIWSENPIATLIKSKEVSESYKNYFEFLWKKAKS